MEIRTAHIPVTTTGTAGSATGAASSELLHGFLLDIYVDYDVSAPGTTDVTIAHTDPTMGDVLAVGAGNTAARYRPRDLVHDTSGAAVSPDFYDRIPLNGYLTVSVTGSDALDAAVVVTARYLGL